MIRSSTGHQCDKAGIIQGLQYMPQIVEFTFSPPLQPVAHPVIVEPLFGPHDGLTREFLGRWSALIFFLTKLPKFVWV